MIKETRNSGYIHQNELDNAFFQHDMSHRDVKDFPRRKASNEVLRNKAFNAATTSEVWWVSKRSCFNGLQRFCLERFLILPL